MQRRMRARLAGALVLVLPALAFTAAGPTEAPTGFDNQTIDPGFVSQADHAEDQKAFDGAEEVDEGLGPLYNAQACRECHQSPVSGAASQITELRVGHLDARGVFATPEYKLESGTASEVISGRSLVNDRAICAEIQMRVPATETIRALRLSLNTLGDGLIEAVADQTLIDLRERQCRQSGGRICGLVLKVPVLEAPGQTAVGRFGWKNQHASLLSFSADAYLNEMGITNRLLTEEVTTMCAPAGVTSPNDKPVPGETIEDVDRFARFMRASKAPPRDAAAAASDAGQRGAQIFDQIGCSTCHVATLQTAPAGTRINGGQYTVPGALGDRIFHPYSDFLLHNVGTGDGIPVSVVESFGVPKASARAAARGSGNAEAVFSQVDRMVNRRGGFSSRALHDARNHLRTPPLWGLRARSRLMHDGASVQYADAILRHENEGQDSAARFRALPAASKADLERFLYSL